MRASSPAPIRPNASETPARNNAIRRSSFRRAAMGSLLGQVDEVRGRGRAARRAQVRHRRARRREDFVARRGSAAADGLRAGNRAADCRLQHGRRARRAGAGALRATMLPSPSSRSRQPAAPLRVGSISRTSAPRSTRTSDEQAPRLPADRCGRRRPRAPAAGGDEEPLVVVRCRSDAANGASASAASTRPVAPEAPRSRQAAPPRAASTTRETTARELHADVDDLLRLACRVARRTGDDARRVTWRQIREDVRDRLRRRPGRVRGPPPDCRAGGGARHRSPSGPLPRGSSRSRRRRWRAGAARAAPPAGRSARRAAGCACAGLPGRALGPEPGPDSGCGRCPAREPPGSDCRPAASRAARIASRSSSASDLPAADARRGSSIGAADQPRAAAGAGRSAGPWRGSRRARRRGAARARCRASGRPAGHRGPPVRTPRPALPRLPAELLEEVLGQQRDVVVAIAQRRQRDWEDVQTVEEVLPEGPGLDSRGRGRGWSRR